MKAELIWEQNGLSILSFEILNRYGIKHGMAVRSNGCDVDKEQVYKKLETGGRLAVTHQVHGDHIKTIPPEFSGYYPKKIEADGLMTQVPGVVITIHTADCVPIFLADKENKAVCLIHAGWKGTDLGIARNGLQQFMTAYGLEPGSIAAVIGPAIEQNCYQVGSEVADRFCPAVKINEGGGKWRLDLKDENRSQLIKAGLLPDDIHVSKLCTFCQHSLLHSYRREKELKGQMISFMEA
ncbi:MAG: peptidoglycan editing factor PgeF [Deltaproteobacteria bacterium]|nr:peptidoglycan editing factor PgeF [Deltaproteobacteria bacterium]